MSALDRLNFILATYGRLIAGIFHLRLWPPFLLYLLIMLAEIWLLRNMFSPLISGWLIPIAKWLSNEGVVHYPQHISYIPAIFERMNILFSWLVDSLLSGSAVLMFAALFEKEKVRFFAALKKAFQNYHKLLFIWLVVFVPILLLFWVLPGLFEQFVLGAPRRKVALMLGMQGLQTLITSLFVYVVPFLLLKGTSLGRSFVNSFSFFFQSFFTTIFIVGLPQFALLILVYALQNSPTIVEKFNPEVVVWLTMGHALALTLSNYFTLGAIVRFFREYAED